MLPNRKSFSLVLVLVEVTVLLVEEDVVARFLDGWCCCHVRFDLVLRVVFNQWRAHFELCYNMIQFLINF